MAFHNDARLPEEVERGAHGGPQFKTTVLTLNSGFEKRNIDWERTRGAWDVGYGMLPKGDQEDDEACDHTFSQVLAFFYARQGRAHSFRFKDWSDFEVGNDALDLWQSIGTGDGIEDTFQIFKRYSSGGIDYDRIITRPIDGTLRVFFDGVEQFAGFTLDDETGLITFSSPPALNVDIEVIVQFDVPVRFDTDSFGITLQTFQAGQIPNLPIVEVRGE